MHYLYAKSFTHCIRQLFYKCNLVLLLVALATLSQSAHAIVPPGSVTATASTGQITVSWTAITGSGPDYFVYRSASTGGPYTKVSGLVTTTSYADTGLTCSATYYYVVTSFTTVYPPTESGNSSEVNATTPTVTPPVPSGVTATGGTAQVSLTWTGSSCATSYNVKCSTVSGSGYATVGTPAAQSFTNTGLANFTTYYYVVSAVNSAGESANSSQVSATTSLVPPSPATATAGTSQVVLAWTAVPNIVNYSVYRSTTSGGAYTQVTVAGNVTTYTNTGLTNGTTYYYVIRCFIAGGPPTESGNSNEVSAKPLSAAPTGLAATPSGTQVSLSWNAVTSATSYNVKRSTTNGGPYTTISSPGTNSYINTGLTAGSTYYYVVSAILSGIESFDSSQASATLIPAIPTGLTATAGDTQVALSWTASSGATTYNVKRSTTSGTGYVTVSSPASASYTNTGLTNGITYYYVVSAVNGGGESANSSQASATPEPPIPGTPTGLIATAGDTQVALSWTASSGATTYNVKRSTTSGSGYATVSSPGTNSYTNTGLTNGITYYYVVSAVNGGGESANSSQASATPEPPIPGTPTGLTATAGDTQVALSWTASTGATTYNVKRSTISGSGYSTVSSPGTNSYTDTGLTNGTTYYYVVSAVNAGGESANSSQASAIPEPPIPGTPTGLTATAGDTQISLAWTASTGATTYNVKRASVTGGPYTTITSPTSASYTNTGLTNGTTYYYVVSAVNTTGESANSSEASGTPQPPIPATPTGLTVIPGPTPISVDLSWTASSGATTYNVKRSTISGSGYATVSSPATNSYRDTGLTVGATYYYVVSAVNAGGESGNSSEVSITLLPDIPTGLTATAGNTQVALSWTASSGATTYNVKRSTTSGSGYATVSSPGTNSYTNTGLTNGTTYYYVVSAVNVGGESGNSSEASATPTP